ncbi:TolC family protein [bacterium endosymbiont of Bathymodiolus sp. 5 South]|jgi:cobalt-zinc-cadmium efflux system outer membrane protein|uniref:TolC family protein n=1 Tax=bacterium endosymbiont of Bathymodiolus sp. 5 South TaxID=1181670 RepID=UPI0010BC059B|nr:TolC family protein [bacterium endosymbiont of Bathymodiolus sp. 5 South]CAC9641224.1 hypothetical protein [uncultured Gammaproteobacteria bacterium]CAC9655329.1 hypothetical protein [uncultured Gammaproteobacteria bacterium]SHN91012.1 hypothetical protein BCLUESOX_1239 [bacterium endosymbiont of Bathymodiolus sp. 5 South]VVH56150.1 hypothetical protein BSPCLSOX_1041 [uncultured Gammaproteobacteria bacterium]VVH63681.1 hypothetical protein BSPWISOX_225 [uncultured Gammaproteobacteria bacter
MKYKKILPIIVICLTLSNPIYSQENRSFLSTFIRDVWQFNPILKEIDARVEVARAKRTADSKWLYNPEIGFAVDNKNGAPISKIISISQSIDWSGKAAAAGKVANFELQSLIAKREQVQYDLAVNALSKLAKYQLTDESLDLSNHRVEVMRRFSTFASNAFKIGDINQSSYNLARLAYSQALIQNTDAKVAFRQSKQALEMSIGFPVIDLPSLPNTLPDIKQKNIQNLVERLPKIRLLKNKLTAAKAEISQAALKQTADPTINITGGKSEGDNTVGLSLSIPFNIFNDYSAEVDMAKYQAIAEEAVLQNAHYLAQVRLKNHQKIYQLLHSAWQTWRQEGASTLLNQVKTLENKFKAGDINATDYLVQVEQTLDSEIAAKDLHAKAWEAWFNWLSASGEVKQWLGE